MAINSIANLTDSTVAGSNTEIQYNNSGVFGASSNLTFDGSTLTVTGDLSVAGNYTNSAQPAFQARKSANATNATGDNTAYTMTYDTERFDQGSDYNNSTYTFTAPVTGKYQFNVQVLIAGLASAHTYGNIDIITSNRTYFTQSPLESDVVATQTLEYSMLADMDAADTAYVTVRVSGSTKTVTVEGATDGTNHFTGYLVC